MFSRIQLTVIALAVASAIPGWAANETGSMAAFPVPLASGMAIYAPSDARSGNFDGNTELTPKRVEVKGSDSIGVLSIGSYDFAVRVEPPNRPSIQIANRWYTLGYDSATRTWQSATVRLGSQTYHLKCSYAHAVGQTRFTCWRSGGVQQATVEGTKVWLYDDDTDGKYEMGQDAIGLASPGSPIAVFAPLHKYVSFGPQLLEIDRVAEDGGSIAARQSSETTGTLAVSSANPNVQYFLAFVSKEHNATALANNVQSKAFNLAAVPGEYQLQQGLVYSRADRRFIACISTPRATDARSGAVAGPHAAGVQVDVRAGETSTMVFGNSLKFEAGVNVTGRKLTISSSSFKFTGSAGEEYTKVGYAAPPEVYLARGDKLTLLGKMAFG